MILDSCASTQDEVLARWRAGERPPFVLARSQTAGRGRFGRDWISPPGTCLAVSAAFPEWTDHPAPWLLGCLVALVAAELTDVSVRWPNDLAVDGRKVGGVLHERPTVDGRPLSVVGLGMNLRAAALPPEVHATSLEEALRPVPEAVELWTVIAAALRAERRPVAWSDLEPRWMRRDATPGKRYRLPDGREAGALGIGPEGELLTTLSPVRAAEAIFGA